MPHKVQMVGTTAKKGRRGTERKEIKRATVKRRRLGRKVFDLTDANPKRGQAAKAFSNQFRDGRGLKRTTNRGRKAANRGGSRR